MSVKQGKASKAPKLRAAGVRQREAAAGYRRKVQSAVRDIGPMTPWIQAIDWDRRLATVLDLRLFLETYLGAICYLPWSVDQLRCIARMQQVFTKGGLYSLGMPRAGGKTALCRGGILWGTAHGYRRFPVLIGASQLKAVQSLRALQSYWYASPLLRQDFPEIAYPIWRLEHRWHLARGQTCDGQPTCIEWTTDTLRYPCLIFDDAGIEPYRLHAPDLVLDLGGGRYTLTTAGILVRTAGIEGSIRGEADTHPVLLTQPRPDIVVLDDIQKDVRADSPLSTAKMILLIDGAIQGLAGPARKIAGLMACTVMREDDVSDTYLDPEKKPEWSGERCRLVTRWPDGITDTEMHATSPAGQAWTRYADLRVQSLREHKDHRLATDYYRDHRAVMDEGFVCAWPERYDRTTELSAQQAAMNLRLVNTTTFLSEYQNQGRKRSVEAMHVPITTAQLARKISGYDRGEIPAECHHLVAFIDVQNEIAYYSVLAAADDFTGIIADYGTWPSVSRLLFAKYQTESWSLVSRAFFEAYPAALDPAWVAEGGHQLRAPFEPKIYFLLQQTVAHIRGLRFARKDPANTRMQVARIGIDATWGQATSVIKRYCAECGIPEVVPCQGRPFLPTHRQLENYMRDGQYRHWVFEDQRHPQAKETSWVYKTDVSGQYFFQTDVNRLKSFVLARFASPPGSSGSWSLFRGSPGDHELYAQHICESEYPEPVTAMGMTKDCWLERKGHDNDWLDTTVGCVPLASMLGAHLRIGDSPAVSVTPARSLRDIYDAKRLARRMG